MTDDIKLPPLPGTLPGTLLMMEEREQRDEALLKRALKALESADWYIGQLEWIVYSPDDTGTHEERAKVQSTIAALRERIGEGAAMICAKETSHE